MNRSLRVLIMALTILIGASASPAHAAEGCSYDRDQLVWMDRHDYRRILDLPECTAIYTDVLDVLEARYLGSDGGASLESHIRDDVVWTVASGRLKSTLGEGDLPGALDALFTLRARIDQSLPATPLAGYLSSELQEEFRIQEVEAMMRWIGDFIEDIELALTANPYLHDRFAVADPGPDWFLHNTCRTAAMNFHRAASSGPSRVDAWLVAGRPGTALQALFADHWLHSLSYGFLPPRLEEVASRAYGADAYREEVAHTIASIRIYKSPSGRYAETIMFGTVLPLPVGAPPQRGSLSTAFVEADDVAAFLGPLFANHH